MNHGGSQAINHQRVEGTSLKSCVANIAISLGNLKPVMIHFAFSGRNHKGWKNK